MFPDAGYAEVVNAGKSKTSEDQAVCIEDSLAKVGNTVAATILKQKNFCFFSKSFKVERS